MTRYQGINVFGIEREARFKKGIWLCSSPRCPFPLGAIIEQSIRLSSVWSRKEKLFLTPRSSHRRIPLSIRLAEIYKTPIHLLYDWTPEELAILQKGEEEYQRMFLKEWRKSLEDNDDPFTDETPEKPNPDFPSTTIPFSRLPIRIRCALCDTITILSKFEQ